MSQENVDAVRRALEDYCRGDYVDASAYLAPDVVWHVGQEPPAQGPAEVREVWKRWDADWQELETVAEQYIDAGHAVVVAVLYRGRGRASGVEVEDRRFEVHTFPDGRCVSKVDFTDRSDALGAAGLPE